MPRPSTSFVSAKSCSSAPSPQPTSSTREGRATISAISRWSTRLVVCGAGASILPAAPGAAFDAEPHRGGIEEAANGGEELGLIEQEGVVALVGLHLDEADVGGDGIQRMH